MKTPLKLNDAPCGSERTSNGAFFRRQPHRWCPSQLDGRTDSIDHLGQRGPGFL